MKTNKQDFAEKTWLKPDGTIVKGTPEFSTDIKAAWLIIDELQNKRGVSQIEIKIGKKGTTVRIDEKCEAFSKTTPHAICLAALAFVGEVV